MASTDNLTHFLTDVADAIREKNGTSDPINAQNFADAIRSNPITEDTIADWGFTKNTGDYIKPTTGIPKSDLDSSVQTSLEKADTALQSYTEQYKGTITGVSANGTSVATSGVANIPAASTSKYGVTKLTSSTSSTSTTLAATASAVKSAYDLANKKQDILTSGTNIKTINGESILGSGNVTINGVYYEINHGTSDTTFVLTPNTFHVWDIVSNLTLTLGDEIEEVANEYLFQFTSGDVSTMLNLPASIRWMNDKTPIVEPNKIYQVSIMNGLGIILPFDRFSTISFTIQGVEHYAKENMTWTNWVNSVYNTEGWIIDNGSVKDSSNNVSYNTIKNVSSTDIIFDGHAYTTIYVNNAGGQ